MTKFLLPLLIALSWVQPLLAAAPVVSDSVIAGNAGSSVTTGNITVGGSNRALYVFIGNSDGSPQAVSSVTWNGGGGQSLTRIHDTGVANFQQVEIWRLIAPAAATNTVSVSMAGATTVAIVIAVAVEDIDQSTPNGTIVDEQQAPNTDSETIGPTVTSATGELVLDYSYRFADADQFAGAGQTQLEEGFFVEANGASSTQAGAASVAMTWTAPGTSTVFQWAYTSVGLSLKPVSGGGGGANLPAITYYLQQQRKH